MTFSRGAGSSWPVWKAVGLVHGSICTPTISPTPIPTCPKSSPNASACRRRVVRAVPGVTVQAGSDWDLAMGQWGSAEVAATYTQARYSGTVGLRRYRPHFELWTIWGAFSPVPYHTWFARGSAHAAAWLDIRSEE